MLPIPETKNMFYHALICHALSKLFLLNKNSKEKRVRILKVWIVNQCAAKRGWYSHQQEFFFWSNQSGGIFLATMNSKVVSL
jgi:hypothetical protein